MHDIRYNEARDELYVNNPFAQAILTFRGGADGQEAPIRTIRTAADGTPALQIGNPGAVAYDSKRDELLVPN